MKKNDSMIVRSCEVQLEDLNNETCKKSQSSPTKIYQANEESDDALTLKRLMMMASDSEWLKSIEK